MNLDTRLLLHDEMNHTCEKRKREPNFVTWKWINDTIWTLNHTLDGNTKLANNVWISYSLIEYNLIWALWICYFLSICRKQKWTICIVAGNLHVNSNILKENMIVLLTNFIRFQLLVIHSGLLLFEIGGAFLSALIHWSCNACIFIRPQRLTL